MNSIPRFTLRDSVPARSRGFTLIEVLVVIGVVGALIAIALPAVQMVRASARNMQCRSHLKQIALAYANYESTHGMYPAKRNWSAYHRPLFPFLEIPTGAESSPILACPADSDALGLVHVDNVSYLLSSGVDDDGMMGRRHFTTARDVTDGLSNTAAFSEKIAAPFPAEERYKLDWLNPTPRMLRWLVLETQVEHDTIAAFSEECRQRARVSTPHLVSRTTYDHIVTPNGPNCWNGYPLGAPPQRTAETASSDHAGGVHVAMADGSVRFVSDSIAREVWWAIGTRKGGESNASGF